MPVLAQQSVLYEFRFRNAVHHEAEVKAVFQGVTTPSLDVVISRSSPGRYALHEFAKNVYNVRVSDGTGRPLQVEQLTPSTWQVNGHHGTVAFEYTLFGDRVDGTYDAIDDSHAHLNMPATLAWARGYEHAPASLHFFLPEGRDWQVATQLLPERDGTWSAPNLDWLMDSPVELSVHSLQEWRAENSLFRLAAHYAGTKAEISRFARMCEAVVLEEEGVFGGFPRYEGGAYTFLIDASPYASGDGMEHRDSTVITGPRELAGGNEGMIGAVSHEFFHSWNVKRIRPRSLEPFDFTKANMSGELWFAEGFTNYYGPLVLQRAGITTLDQFSRTMGSAINTVINAPGHLVHSAVEMSRLAPFVDAATSIDRNNFPNTYISYYTYGQALALAIDLAIRAQFPGKSLDTWMKVMWREHPDVSKPYTLDDLRKTLTTATGSEQFAQDVFSRHINSRDPFDYPGLLTKGGLLLRQAHPGQPWWGKASLTVSGTGAEIATETIRGTPLYDAGLDRGDRIIAVDGELIQTNADVDKVIKSHRAGDRLALRVRTHTGERNVALVLAEDPQLELVTFEQAGKPTTPEIIAFRQSWLGSKALHPLPKVDPNQ